MVSIDPFTLSYFTKSINLSNFHVCVYLCFAFAMTNSSIAVVSEWEGEVLEIARISRLDMSAYLCIASNGVPPSVSKR